MHFDTSPNRSKFVKFGICAPGPQSAPRCTETATFAKGFFQSSNLRKMLTCFTKSLITFSSNCVSLSKTLECPQTLHRGSLWPLFAYVYWKTQLFQIILRKSNGFFNIFYQKSLKRYYYKRKCTSTPVQIGQICQIRNLRSGTTKCSQMYRNSNFC